LADGEAAASGVHVRHLDSLRVKGNNRKSEEGLPAAKGHPGRSRRRTITRLWHTRARWVRGISLYFGHGNEVRFGLAPAAELRSRASAESGDGPKEVLRGRRRPPARPIRMRSADHLPAFLA